MNNVVRLVTRTVASIAMGGALAESGTAESIDNCTGVRPIPCYTIRLTVPGSSGNMGVDSELSPVDGNLSGLDDRLVGSGSAFAVARFGSVGAKAEVTNTSPVPLFDAPVGALARATFQDVLLWNGGAGTLRFTFDLDAIPLVTGMDPGLNIASVDATLSLSSTESVDETAFGRPTAPGSLTVTIDMLPFDGVNFTLELLSSVGPIELVHGVSEFIDTAGIARIVQLDHSGNFFRDVTLADIKGNVLGAPPGTASEPATFALVGTVLFAVRILAKSR